MSPMIQAPELRNGLNPRRGSANKKKIQGINPESGSKAMAVDESKKALGSER